MNREHRNAGTGPPVSRRPPDVVEDRDLHSSGGIAYQPLDFAIVNALDFFVVVEVGQGRRQTAELESFPIEARLTRERPPVAYLHVLNVHLRLAPGGFARVPGRNVGPWLDARIDDVVEIRPYGPVRTNGLRIG